MERDLTRKDKPQGTPLTEDVVQSLIAKGYNAGDLIYLGHFTKEEVLMFTPKDFSEMADSFAQMDDRLLGC